MLIASLLFYAWGEGHYRAIILFSILANYPIGLHLNRRSSQCTRRLWLIVGVVVNLLTIGIFKYTNWLVANAAKLFAFSAADILPEPIDLPIGSSFFTLQALSYIIDGYRQETVPQQTPIRLGSISPLFHSWSLSLH